MNKERVRLGFLVKSILQLKTSRFDAFLGPCFRLVSLLLRSSFIILFTGRIDLSPVKGFLLVTQWRYNIPLLLLLQIILLKNVSLLNWSYWTKWWELLDPFLTLTHRGRFISLDSVLFNILAIDKFMPIDLIVLRYYRNLIYRLGLSMHTWFLVILWIKGFVLSMIRTFLIISSISSGNPFFIGVREILLVLGLRKRLITFRTSIVVFLTNYVEFSWFFLSKIFLSKTVSRIVGEGLLIRLTLLILFGSSLLIFLWLNIGVFLRSLLRIRELFILICLFLAGFSSFLLNFG